MYMIPFMNTKNMMAEMMNDFFGAAHPATFRTDVRETEGSYEIAADLPGVKPEDINVSVTGDVLTVTANFGNEEKTETNGYARIERRSGKISRAFNIRGVEKDGIVANHENGVLKLTLPKLGKEIPETRQIAINAPEHVA